MTQPIQSYGDSAPPYRFEASAGFADFLLDCRISLALTTYQVGKLFLVGTGSDRQLVVTERSFARCLGVAAAGSSLFLAGLHEIIRFENVLSPGQIMEGCDAIYVPKVSWYTGDVFAHDIGVTASGRPLFVNTLFSCLATVDDVSSFRPVWQPPFISRLTPEDRCHLNGLAMDQGQPRFVTAAGATDTARGWRDGRVGSGVLLDVASGETVAHGLTMPHSPRLHEGRLYLANAGTGELVCVDLYDGRFEPVAFCPGFVRGLALVGPYALIGLSLPRQHRDFSGLPLDDRLKAENRQADCVMQVIDLRTGAVVHWLRIGGVVREFYDVTILPGIRMPMPVGFAGGQINTFITKGQYLPLSELGGAG
jgi:uncharacterized protein (TIGR03032 family)